MPGPGSYPIKEKLGKEGSKYTLQGRPKTGSKHIAAPGPGAYNPIEKASKVSSYSFRYGIYSEYMQIVSELVR